jgi:hypothetical protein
MSEFKPIPGFAMPPEHIMEQVREIQQNQLGAVPPDGAPPEPTRMFPIQRGEPIPWAAAERAYATYSKLYGKQQSLERLAQRGGFGLHEWACLYLGHENQCRDGDRCIMQALRGARPSEPGTTAP